LVEQVLELGETSKTCEELEASEAIASLVTVDLSVDAFLNRPCISNNTRYIRNVLALQHTEQNYDLLKHNCLYLNHHLIP